VSIIAGCYNHSNYVEELLNSVINQTYKNIQLIIFDDCSSDNSAEIIQKWINDKRISCVFLRHIENKGLAYSLNEALKYVEGKYFQLISCDDILVNNKIEIQVNLFETQLSEEYGCVASNFSTIDENSKIIKERYFAEKFIFPENTLGAILSNDLGYGIIIHSPTVLYRKNILDKTGFFDEKIMQEDLDFLVRVCLNFKVAFCHQPLVKYRMLHTSMSRNIKTLDRLYFERLTVIQNYESLLLDKYAGEFYQHQLNYIFNLLKGKSFDNTLEEKLSPFMDVLYRKPFYANELDNTLIKTQTISRLIELMRNNKFSHEVSLKYILYKKVVFTFISIIKFVNRGIRKVLRMTVANYTFRRVFKINININ